MRVDNTDSDLSLDCELMKTDNLELLPTQKEMGQGLKVDETAAGNIINGDVLEAIREGERYWMISTNSSKQTISKW